MKWRCPYEGCDGVELGARSSPSSLGLLRQCPKCAKQWTLKGEPVPPSMHHRFKAVMA